MVRCCAYAALQSTMTSNTRGEFAPKPSKIEELVLRVKALILRAGYELPAAPSRGELEGRHAASGSRFGMTRTSMTWRKDFEGNVAIGYDETGKALGHKQRGGVRAAGSMDTTVDDYARLVAAMVRGEGLKPATHAAWPWCLTWFTTTWGRKGITWRSSARISLTGTALRGVRRSISTALKAMKSDATSSKTRFTGRKIFRSTRSGLMRFTRLWTLQRVLFLKSWVWPFIDRPGNSSARCTSSRRATGTIRG